MELPGGQNKYRKLDPGPLGTAYGILQQAVNIIQPQMCSRNVANH